MIEVYAGLDVSDKTTHICARKKWGQQKGLARKRKAVKGGRVINGVISRISAARASARSCCAAG